MFKLAPLFGNGCVLVRNKEIRIFGGATEGTRVTAELRAADGSLLVKGSAMAQDGSFLLRLPPQKAATGCTLHVTDGEMLIVSENVAIGEVYFAAGQSNMELELQNADEGKGLIEVHNDPAHALCDGAQSIKPDAFAEVMADIRNIAKAVGREI